MEQICQICPPQHRPVLYDTASKFWQFCFNSKKLSSYAEVDSHKCLMGACLKPQVLLLGHYIRISAYVENNKRETYKADFFL